MNTNRILDEVNRWETNEEKLSKILPNSVSNGKFLKLKLNFFEKIEAKYGGTKDLGEQMLLAKVRDRAKEIERLIYPKKANRWWQRLFRPIFRQFDLRKERVAIGKHNEGLKQDLVDQGFKGAIPELERKISEGAKSIIVQMSYFTTSREKVDFRISFERNDEGKYERKGVEAALTPQGSEKTVRHNFVDGESVMHALKMQSLLAGRAVKEGPEWTQLDFNDRDATGSAKMRSVPVSDGFDLYDQLERAKHLVNLVDAYSALARGIPYRFKGDVDGQQRDFTLHADPLNDRLYVLDPEGKPVSLTNLKRENTFEEFSLSMKGQEHKNVVKHGMSVVR
ncbi:hypothetical protein [Olivibacter jilunii]|uniref:hypothetical protein n=1 Tax=Olivibacter jilunii TaxID=985016 RepID=UPI0010304621|nr:hypothetical protein [Olivibacter jilunii]